MVGERAVLKSGWLLAVDGFLQLTMQERVSLADGRATVWRRRE
jgi:hypothetical protein